MKKLDYSAYEEPLTKEDLASVPNDPSSKLNKIMMKFGIAAGFVTVAVVLLIRVVSLTNGSGAGVLFTGLVYIVVLAVIGFAGIYGLTSRRKKLAKMMKFAKQNGLDFRYDTIPMAQKGLIFDNGHTRKINELFQFPDGSEIGNYEFVTGSGNSRRVHAFVYVRIALKRHLPNMVLDSRHNNYMGFSNLADTFHKSQRLTLEGDFNKYFDVYVPNGYERDALYVFTPDVMQVLIDKGRVYDIEIVDNELYIYSGSSIDMIDPVRLSGLLDVVNSISSELRDQTKRYADEKVPTSLAGLAVANEGRRLRKGNNYLLTAIIASFVLLHYGGMLLPEPLAEVTAVILGAGIWLALLAFLYLAIKQLRRRM